MDQAAVPSGSDPGEAQPLQVHGARADGSVAFRKKLRASLGKCFDFLAFSAAPAIAVAMEACGMRSTIDGRSIGRRSSAARSQVGSPDRYTCKPFGQGPSEERSPGSDAGRRPLEAAQRPTMSFVAVKTEDARAGQRDRLNVRTRDLLATPGATQTINAVLLRPAYLAAEVWQKSLDPHQFQNRDELLMSAAWPSALEDRVLGATGAGNAS